MYTYLYISRIFKYGHLFLDKKTSIKFILKLLPPCNCIPARDYTINVGEHFTDQHSFLLIFSVIINDSIQKYFSYLVVQHTTICCLLLLLLSKYIMFCNFIILWHRTARTITKSSNNNFGEEVERRIIVCKNFIKENCILLLKRVAITWLYALSFFYIFI